MNFSELESIVATNEKKRFQLIPIPGFNSSSASEPSSNAEPNLTRSTEVSSLDSKKDPARYLIRASQGHSIHIDSASLLTPILPTDADFPAEVVHGTSRSAWKLIQESGGLSRMERQHVHFAKGLGSTYTAKPKPNPNPNPSVSKDGARAEDQAPESSGENEEGVPEVQEETESTKVISGMRNSATLFVWVDVRRSMEMGGLRWWKSANEVILTEGNEHGIVPLEFVKRAVQRNYGCIWRNKQLGKTASSATTPRKEETKEGSG